MIFINIFIKDKFIGMIYGDDAEIKDNKTINIHNKNNLIASINLEKIEKIREQTYNLYI